MTNWDITIGIEYWALPIVLLILIGTPIAMYLYGRYQVNRSWRQGLRNTPLGIVRYRSNGRRTFANTTAEALLHQLDATQIEQQFVRNTDGFEHGAVVGGRDGAVVQVQSFPLDRSRGGVVLTLRDLAQQRAATESYRKFIHTISHELLTPMTSMRSHLSHLASTQTEGDDWQRSLDVVRDDVERLIRLATNLLILSRLEAGQPLQRRPTNLAALAEEVVLQLIEKADERQITLNVNADPQLARPPIDRDAWKQVLLNLIDNGIKYGPDGGAVSVILRQQGDVVSIAVADDGPGIAPDDIPHLFTEMFRAEAQRHVSGTGLGLAIVKRIIEQHGGQITCSSELGRGTTFHISLPLVSPA